MPAKVIFFHNVDRPPVRAFVETSFLRGLIDFSSRPDDPRLKAVFGFWQKAKASNTQLWTTPFTAEEILWAYVRRELKAVCETRNVATIRDLKRSYRQDYRDALFGCRPQLATMVRALNRYRISFEFPRENAGIRGPWGAMVWERVGKLVEKFELETADALHIACAMVGGGEMITVDSDFKEVDELTVYCYA